MKIELTSIKLNKTMSDETPCFSAAVVVDGVRRGTVENRGCGGCNEYSFRTDDIDAYIATLPSKALPPEWGCGDTMEQDLDSIIFNLLDQYEDERQFKRWCKTQVVFRLKGDKAGEWRTLKADWNNAAIRSRILEVMAQRYGDKVEEILNRRFE